MSLDASTLTWAALWVRGWGCRCVQLGNAESVSSALFSVWALFFLFFLFATLTAAFNKRHQGAQIDLTLWASERRHSEQQPEWFFYLLTSVIPRDKTCCELRPRAERILPPRCQPIKATFSPTDETRSNHKFNSNLIFYNLRFEPFFMSCRYNRTFLTTSQ